MIASITRKLEDGADYSPDWRHQVVIEHLKAHAASGGNQPWECLLEHERDVVVRQVVRYHLDAGCLIPGAVRYAIRCQQENRITGLASTIRAMVVAGFTFDEIAAELKTARRHILVFCWLHFDVERYLDHDVWLESLVRRDFCDGHSAARTRERRLMRIAFNEGLAGIAKVLNPRRQKTSQDVQALADQVRHAVAARALEFVQDLEDNGVPAGPEDFNRHLMVSSAAGREQRPNDEGGLEARVRAWFMELGDSGIFPPGLIKMGLGLRDGDDFALGGERRRRNVTIEADPLEGMDGERAATTGTEDNSKVWPKYGAVEPHDVKVA